MLVLTRRPNESIVIANNIKITVVSVGPGRVKLGIEAPPDVRVDRQEIHEKLEQAADVLLAVAGGEATSDAPNTMSHGPDTATFPIAAPAEAPAKAPAPQVGPAVPQSPLSKFRSPRKPR
jgi:carbon storage regulator